MTTTAVNPALLLTGVVRRVERLSPSFVRVTLGGPGFEHLGPDGPTLDQRIKLLVPDAGRPLPIAALDPADWYAAWLALPEADRGHLRTYTARAVEGEGRGRRLVVDFVLHGIEGDTSAGHVSDVGGAAGRSAPGPASIWAAAARPGDEIGVLAPRRGHGNAFGGIEFAPGAARRLLLVADETALPALASILESLPADAEGVAIVEVPVPGDFLDIATPPGVALHRLARGTARRGAATIETLRACLDLPDPAGETVHTASGGTTLDEVWETPLHSSSGIPLDTGADAAEAVGPGQTYAWVAGDSATVTRIRRLLVGELRLPRSQVAFMGYWKESGTRR